MALISVAYIRQACRSFQAVQQLPGDDGNWRKRLLRAMIEQAKQKDLPPSGSQLLDVHTVPTTSLSIRERAKLLTPLLTDCVKNADKYLAGCLPHCHCASELPTSVRGVGNPITTVIRMMKAWSRFGLALELQTSQAVSSDEKAKPPPGYIWEILVLHVFQQRLRQHAASGVSTAHPYGVPDVRVLNLFMDVLHAASESLRPARSNQQEPAPIIAATFLYSQEELGLFKDQWGPPGPLCTPYIIHPADPSFNCTRHVSFVRWDAVAEAAGELHQKLQQLLQGPDPDLSQVVVSSSVCSVGSEISRVGRGSTADVWHQVLAHTTLGPAVKVFSETATV